MGAQFRHAEIDPVIVQPIAYHIDRQKSIQVLKQFLERKDTILERERKWLNEIEAHAVLSDAAFIGCLAAKEAGIPSVLITNFTFDSVYSYLSTPVLDNPSPESQTELLTAASGNLATWVSDTAIPVSIIEPLVDEILEGYRGAELLLLLPGYIPIPSFFSYPCLPAQDWVDLSSNKFHHDIIEHLHRQLPPCTISPFALSSFPRNRCVIPAPLLVRSPKPSIFSLEGRTSFFTSIGVPPELHDPTQTKVLVVSFGGQVFRAPSRPGSRDHTPGGTPTPSPASPRPTDAIRGSYFPADLPSPRPFMTSPSHLWIPGALPASKPTSSTIEPNIPELLTIPPSPAAFSTSFMNVVPPLLLPDSSWIAIVCGASKDQWNCIENEGLPEGFFVAPKDVYMPDLTAIADVLLGKLGYGTVSECLDSCTPFVYVSRPLFIEELGLRLLLEKRGVGVELSRHAYESGDWAASISEAWARGEPSKTRKRFQAASGIGTNTRMIDGLNMAEKIVTWTKTWWTLRDII